jgi:hypothetical protein
VCAVSAAAGEASTPNIGEGERVGGMRAQAALTLARGGGPGSALDGGRDDSGGSGGAEARGGNESAGDESTAGGLEKASACSNLCCMGVWHATEKGVDKDSAEPIGGGGACDDGSWDGIGGGRADGGGAGGSPAEAGEAEARAASLAAKNASQRRAWARRVEGDLWRRGWACCCCCCCCRCRCC